MYASKLSAPALARKIQHQQTIGSKPISQQQVVLALMPKLVEKVIRPSAKDGCDITYQIQRCPKGNLCKNASTNNQGWMIGFQDNTGYNNSYKQMLACCFDNCVEQMMDKYWETQANMKQQVFLTKFVSSATQVPMPDYFIITQQDCNTFDLVDMIVMEDWPMTSIANPRYHRVIKQQSRFGINTVRAVILAMTEILAAELKAAVKGSIVNDAWSKFGLHFFALFATYMATREITEDGMGLLGK
jgi:hypothetical protein